MSKSFETTLLFFVAGPFVSGLIVLVAYKMYAFFKKPKSKEKRVSNE